MSDLARGPRGICDDLRDLARAGDFSSREPLLIALGKLGELWRHDPQRQQWYGLVCQLSERPFNADMRARTWHCVASALCDDFRDYSAAATVMEWVADNAPRGRIGEDEFSDQMRADLVKLLERVGDGAGRSGGSEEYSRALRFARDYGLPLAEARLLTKLGRPNEAAPLWREHDPDVTQRAHAAAVAAVNGASLYQARGDVEVLPVDHSTMKRMLEETVGWCGFPDDALPCVYARLWNRAVPAAWDRIRTLTKAAEAPGNLRAALAVELADAASSPEFNLQDVARGLLETAVLDWVGSYAECGARLEAAALTTLDPKTLDAAYDAYAQAANGKGLFHADAARLAARRAKERDVRTHLDLYRHWTRSVQMDDADGRVAEVQAMLTDARRWRAAARRERAQRQSAAALQ